MASIKKYTRKEVHELKSDRKEAVFIIANNVYNVTEFLDEHPGGHEVLVNMSGKDATEDFNDIGHSLDAKEMMKKYQVGELVDEDKVEIKTNKVNWDETTSYEPGFMNSWKLPIVLGVLATIIYSYIFG